MPIRPFEIMLGKIAPYVLVGFLQATLIVGAVSCCSACRWSAA
jgi:ABC-type Na+ efflux pump permease subunit